MSSKNVISYQYHHQIETDNTAYSLFKIMTYSNNNIFCILQIAKKTKLRKKTI